MRLRSLVTSILLINGVSARPATISGNDVDSLAEFRCAERPRSSPQNCAKALITAFPPYIQPGQFHHGLPNDAFQLPRVWSVGDCRVNVDLRGGENVEGSWEQIWTLANTLSLACTSYKSAIPVSAVTGGYIHAGQGNGLAIVLSKPRDDSSLAD
ncbi:MAG: hypothetical protein Q9196_005903, partial [Gyalolechia fulgens]